MATHPSQHSKCAHSRVRNQQGDRRRAWSATQPLFLLNIRHVLTAEWENNKEIGGEAGQPLFLPNIQNMLTAESSSLDLRLELHQKALCFM